MTPGVLGRRRALDLDGPRRFGEDSRRLGTVLVLAVKRLWRIDGTQLAGAFAFNAFLALFPLIILLVRIASSFVGRESASKDVIGYIESYVPIGGAMQSQIFDAIAGVLHARGRTGAAVLVVLVWAAMQVFTTLIRATNRAWDDGEYDWWKLPLKDLLFLSITVGVVLGGIALPALAKMAKDFLFGVGASPPLVYAFGSIFITSAVMFLSLSLFYRLAPRRPMQFHEVWVAALGATVLLQAAESLFELYLRRFAMLNAVYGIFGGIIALLLWIYISGAVLIFGACWCAAQAQGGSSPALKARTEGWKEN